MLALIAMQFVLLTMKQKKEVRMKSKKIKSSNGVSAIKEATLLTINAIGIKIASGLALLG